jgi:predicted GNAT superfamily acetyltransferase
VSYIIRSCQSINELKNCVVLQKIIWGYADFEIYPLRLFVNVLRIGGHVLGAFTPQGEMTGFVVDLPAWNKRRRFLHSLSLGVLPQHQSRGLGRSLKLEQRKIALREGINRIEWTFDPLRSKNAFFNIVRLGVIARRYVPDSYGKVESALQLGLPTDRLIAEWWLDSSRVKRALEGKPPRSERKAPAATVAVPLDLDALVRDDASQARELQSRVRKELQKCFKRKLATTGFGRTSTEAHYLLDRP